MLQRTLDLMPPAFDAPFDAGDGPESFVEKRDQIPYMFRSGSDLGAYDVQQRLADEAARDVEIVLQTREVEPAGESPRVTDDPSDEQGDHSDDDEGDAASSSERHLDVTADESEAKTEDSPVSTDSVIAESVRESVEAAAGWANERVLELMADVIHPGAGRLINLFFTIKEAFGDAEALVSPDSPRDLHVPLLHITGLEVDLNVHLPGDDGSRDDAPSVSGFLAPGDDGLFCGWAIEADRHPESTEGESSQSNQDDGLAVAKQVAQPETEQSETEQPDRARLMSCPHRPAVIMYDLSDLVWQVDGSWRRAAVLRIAASQLRARLYARAEFAAEPILVIYDPLTGLGMWLVNPGLHEAATGRRIEIRLNLVSGTMAMFVR